jgi:hypothetical protein
MSRRKNLILLMASTALACGSTQTERGEPGASAGGTAMTGTMGSGQGGAAGTAGTTSGGAGNPATAGAGGASVSGRPLVDLPSQSRERAGVVNLVDAAAAAEVEGFLVGTGDSLAQSLNLFLKYYVEQYDFVYFFTDHKLPATTTVGRFTRINESAQAGNGIDYDIEAPGYVTNGRTRGALAIQYLSPGYGPLVHEMVHNWANFLSPEFGFGAGKDGNFGPHWGYAGFRGILGGLDAATLHCEMPAGALPPSCTAEASGRYRYLVGNFNTAGNDVKELAPLELYLMGLVPSSDLPATIPVLADAEKLNDTYDSTTNTIDVEASGINMVQTSAITGKYGEVRSLTNSERAFTAAFVVVSATPASDTVLDDVGERAKNHGGKPAMLSLPEPSFEASTGGRATMDTTLGPRRPTDAAPPEMQASKPCDLLAQNCGNGKACHYVASQAVCGVTRGGAVDTPCTTAADCAQGLGCAPSKTGAARACETYCNNDASAANACAVKCPWYVLSDANKQPLSGLCLAP